MVFPPLSEATQFPYLSLPQLAASWRSQGITTHTFDLNLEYRDNVLIGAAPDDASPVHDDASAVATYQRLSVNYLAKHGFQLSRALRADNTSQRDVDAATAASHRYVLERAVADSWVLSDSTTVAELGDRIAASRPRWSTQWSAETLMDRLSSAGPEPILAFSVPFFSQLVPTLAIAAEVKRRRPAVQTLLGGPTIQMWGALLSTALDCADSIDHWWYGHGERSLGIRDGQLVVVDNNPGLADGFSIDQQACPDFDDIDLTRYVNGGFQFPYRLTMGCFWGRCTFCSYGNRYRDTRAFSQISPATAAGHLLHLHRILGLDCVAVADENVSLRHLLRVMKLVASQGARLTYRVRARLEPELLDLDFCHELAAFGCTQISAGIEVADDATLAFLDKGLSVETAEQAARNLRLAGITVNLSYLDGFGGPDDVTAHHRTRQFVTRHADDFGLDTLQLTIAEPGSRLFEHLSKSAPLVTNNGLAFAAGRVGPSAVRLDEAVAARTRLLEMATTAIPNAERQGRPDLVETGAVRDVSRARLRIATSVGPMNGHQVLADLSWPALITISPEVTWEDQQFTAHSERGARWLGTLAARGAVNPIEPVDSIEGDS